jgi:hypothetical protein
VRTAADIDTELLAVHEQYLRAERRRQYAEAAELWIKLDALLDERAHVPHPRLPSDADGHTSPRPI